MGFAAALGCLSSGAAAGPPGPRLSVHELELGNGMTFLFIERPRTTSIAAGWVAGVGSADESPGRTGLSHLVEHMLFKGTRTVGTREADREGELLREQDDLWERIQDLEGRSGSRIERRLADLRRRFAELLARSRALALLGEYSLLYSEAGAVGLNASTMQDFTFYWVTLPAEKLELWFWLESDRLLHPVFRELYKERDVIDEERRQRVETRPTGPVDRRIRALFWAGTPYAWAPLGVAGDLDRIGRRDLREFYDRHYRPANLTAVLVGALDVERARALAETYFGRWTVPADLSSGPARQPASPTATGEVHDSCDCQPQARVLYPTVAFDHPDSYRLQVLAGVLNGRSGRLYRSLVLGRGIAFSAAAGHHPFSGGGQFAFEAETRGSARPRALVAAWDDEVARLIDEPLGERELTRVKNQVAAEAFRRLKDPTDLLRQILVYAGLGRWREIDDWAPRILAVSAADVRSAARDYLRADRRLVALIDRRAPEAGR